MTLSNLIGRARAGQTEGRSAHDAGIGGEPPLAATQEPWQVNERGMKPGSAPGRKRIARNAGSVKIRKNSGRKSCSPECLTSSSEVNSIA